MHILHVLDAVQDSQQVACMTLEDWCQAKEVDPVLSLVITRLQDGMLGKGQSKVQQTLQKSVSTGGSHNHVLLKKGILYRQAQVQRV